MDKYVVNLPAAKKLKDYLPKGWEVNYWWHLPRVQYDPEKPNYYLMTKPVAQLQGLNSIELYPAPILSEMLELLPVEIEHNNTKYEWAVYKWGIGYVNSKLPRKLVSSFFTASNGHATAAALLYMWLVDEGHLEEREDEPTQ